VIKGMTLRDWFAGQALAGKWENDFTDIQSADSIAENAYWIAICMMNQKKQWDRVDKEETNA